MSNNINFKGIKYYNYNKDVVNAYFNYRLKCDRTKNNRIEKLIEEQKNNPHDIILTYHVNPNNSTQIIEKATVDGVDFVRKKFESVYSMMKRAAKYANKQQKKEMPVNIEAPDRLQHFVFNNNILNDNM